MNITASEIAPKDIRSTQIAGLDILRFLAALLIVFHHLGWRVWYQQPSVVLNYHYFEPFARPGFIGVEIFFVLSGFVIAYSASHATPKSFLLNRAIRLYPAAWICSTLTLVLVAALGFGKLLLAGKPLAQYMLPAWIHALTLFPVGPWIEGSYWTLAVEIGFYTQIFVLLALGAFRWVGVWMTLVGLFSSACLGWTAWRTDFGMPWSPLSRWAERVANGKLEMVSLAHHGCLFALGVLLWLLLLQRFTWGRMAAAVLMLPGIFLDIRLRVEWTGNWWSPLGIWVVAMIAMIASVRYNERIYGVLGKRGAMIARRLGLVTYPLYLVHASVGCAVILRLQPFMPDLMAFLLATAFVIALAYAVNVWVEEPMQRWLRVRLLHRNRPPATLAATAP